jgi:DHA1 family bicyclomycin/chloramphenicol resistance-like MFS transporter
VGWHGNFGLLVLLSALLVAVVWLFLPETKPNPDRDALQPGTLRRHVFEVLSTPDFVLYAVLGGLCVGVVYTALIGAPDLVLTILGRGNFAIMIVSVVILTAFVTGAGMSALFSSRVSPDVFIGAGLAVLLVASAGLMLVALLIGKQGTLANYLTPIGACFVGVGLVVPVSTARAMAPFDENTGMASSLLGSIQMGVAALGTLGMGLLHQGAVEDIPIVFLALAGMAGLLFMGHLAWRGLSALRAA